MTEHEGLVTRLILKNVVVISLAFMILFTSFQAMSALQSSINRVNISKKRKVAPITFRRIVKAISCSWTEKLLLVRSEECSYIILNESALLVSLVRWHGNEVQSVFPWRKLSFQNWRNSGTAKLKIVLQDDRNSLYSVHYADRSRYFGSFHDSLHILFCNVLPSKLHQQGTVYSRQNVQT